VFVGILGDGGDVGLDHFFKLEITSQIQANDRLDHFQTQEHTLFADIIEEVFFAPDIMVKAAFPDSDCPANLSHGGGSITILME
jgi:hypothetical protein